MAWQELMPPRTSSISASKAAVKVSIGRFGQGSTRYLNIGLRADFLADLAGEALPEWRFRVYRGAAESAGKLRLELAPQDGLFVARRRGRSLNLHLRLDLPAGVTAVDRGALPVAPVRDGTAFEIFVPWLRPAEAGPAKAPPRATTGTVDVTARLMGDPAPGRSAADKRKGG